MAYGYEYSLRRRLQELIDELPQDQRAIIAHDPGRFFRRVSMIRNHYTHLEVGMDAEDTHYLEELFYINLHLEALSVLHLLRAIGFPQTMVKKASDVCAGFSS